MTHFYYFVLFTFIHVLNLKSHPTCCKCIFFYQCDRFNVSSVKELNNWSFHTHLTCTASTRVMHTWLPST